MISQQDIRATDMKPLLCWDPWCWLAELKVIKKVTSSGKCFLRVSTQSRVPEVAKVVPYASSQTWQFKGHPV